MRMLMKEKLVEPLNQQIGYELGASNQYIAQAVYFEEEGLPELAGFFYRQSAEERDHGLRIVRFMLDAGAHPRIPETAVPRDSFASPYDAVHYALEQELLVSQQIDRLVTLAVEESDHTTHNFLQWFVAEQVEEVSTFSNLLNVIKHAKENLLWAEEYVRTRGRKAATTIEGGEA
ncbi:MAG TPA: ferritin [Candidatus Nitrosotenuis sp.]|jgi:ferritin|nr:ferritin [Candidatus Nitrosotenuis sp.]